MNPDIWGNYIWYLLHIIVQHPNSSNEKYKKFFYNLQYLLPCPKCRNNYKEHILKKSISSNNNELSEWLFDIHNRVNRDIGKPIQNYKETALFWENEFIKLKNIEDTKLFAIVEYLLYDHPGFYKINTDYINSILIFWNIIPELLPKKLMDISRLKQFLKNNKLTIDIISHKLQYQDWFKKLKKYLYVKITIDKNKNYSRCDK